MFFLSIINSNRYSNQSERSVTQLPENSKCLVFGQAVFQASPPCAREYRLLRRLLTINEHTIKDTFGAKTRIETIDQSYFKGYKYVSFDVESLFTNVRQHRTKGTFHANTVYLFVIDIIATKNCFFTCVTYELS